MKQRLPIGIQDFAKIRQGNFRYVDKTALIYKLVNQSGSAFFLSRPRRFGKSLLCSTIGALFEARRELFGGLVIDALNWEWKKHPVIRIDLNPGNYTDGVSVLNETIETGLLYAARQLNITLSGDTPASRFQRLIEQAHEKYGEQVAVIIDEYDKPLLNTIDSPEIHTALRNALKAFYGVLKSSDAHLRFALFTGVTKFAQVSIFSDLNYITDISLDSRYADLCGITQEELERDFSSEIEDVIQSGGTNRAEYMEKLKTFYNGYRFSKNPLTVYNPFGLLNHFDKGGEFLPYWYETGTPTFLINLIKKRKVDITKIEDTRVRLNAFQKFDAESMEALPLLYQSGYLTIADYDEERNQLTLDYPNEEVRGSFAESLANEYLEIGGDKLDAFIMKFYNAVYDGEVDSMMETMRSFFASISYDLIKESENYYQTVVHLIFRILGLEARSEVRIAAGRIDTLVETKRNVYCFEFKLDGSAREALEQIDSKEYMLPWRGSGKRLFKVGVNFDHKVRNISEWEYAEE